jgi:exodeoxyribonuclease V alpha subunit
VDFDGYFVEYSGEELEELTPAYAISIHKSQGSEYEMVVLVLLPTHSVMLNREIFYTAVSRAKKKIFLISDDIAIQKALHNMSPRRRKTLLPLRLKEIFENP